MYGRAVYEVGRKEFLQHFRSKRLFITAVVLAAVLALATVVGPYYLLQELERNEEAHPGDTVYLEEERQDLAPNMVLVFYLGAPLIGGYMFVQLIAILLTADAVCSEWRNRTIFLLLSKPVPRSAFLLGKYLGTVAALWSVIAALFLVDYAVMQAVLPGNGLEDWGPFLAALGVILLGVAAYSGFAALTSSLTRSTMQSTLLALGAWLLVFPLVASIGFLAVAGDDEFQAQGEYDWAGLEAACGQDPGGGRHFVGGEPGSEPGGSQQTTEAYEEYLACKAPFDEAYEAYYVDRGSPTRDWAAEHEVCREMARQEEEAFYAQYEDQPPRDDEREFHSDPSRPSRVCSLAVNREQSEWEQDRARIRLAKYDEPRVDWSRYFSPGASMTVADDLLRDQFQPWEEAGFSLDAIVAGADATPAHRGLGVLALVGFSVVSVGAAALVVSRRDFE